MTSPPIRLGVDIGGTFTDVVLERGENVFSAKVLTTYDALEVAILDGIAKVSADATVLPGDIAHIIHGTTLAANALIERSGVKWQILRIGDPEAHVLYTLLSYKFLSHIQHPGRNVRSDHLLYKRSKL